MDGTAIIFTYGQYTTPSAKTAHGLVRGTERYRILGLIDSVSAGKDAGEILDGKKRDIPVYPDLSAFLSQGRADYFVIGIANAGGRLDPEWLPHIRQAIEAGMSVVNGMHQYLSDDQELVALAQQHGVTLTDVRKPKKREDLHFWSGEIDEVSCPKIAVLGTDCAVGKRTTARMLTQALRAQGRKAEMIYTGQTGWMQGGRYGFVFDSTLNDFVSGELEQAIVSCWREQRPDVILIEGQAALRNPSGPCGSEMLVSGGADAVILVHPPGRIYYKGWESLGRKIHPLSSETALMQMYGVPVIGIALNTQGLDAEAAKAWKQRYESELGLPVALPIEEGVENLLNVIK